MWIIDDLIHAFHDIFYLVEYILTNLQDLFTILFKPLSFIFSFLKGFLNGFNTTAPATDISWVFPDNILAVFNAIPYFSLITYCVGAGISIFIIVFIFKALAVF